MKISANGHIKFIDPQKTEYTLHDIFELIEFNFGYSPFPKGKTKTKDNNKEYNRVKVKIHRFFKGKEINKNDSKMNRYSKADVYQFLNSHSYAYFLKQTEEKENYQRKVEQAQKEFKEKMNILSSLDPAVMSLEQQKQEIIFRIVVDFIARNFIDIDEELIESDILLHSELAYTSMNDLSQAETLALNRLSGDYKEYYSKKA